MAKADNLNEFVANVKWGLIQIISVDLPVEQTIIKIDGDYNLK